MANGLGLPPLPPDALVDQRNVVPMDAPLFVPEPLVLDPFALDVPTVIPPGVQAAGLAVPPDVVPEALIEIEDPPPVEPEPAIVFDEVPVGVGAVAEDVASQIESSGAEVERLEQRRQDLQRVARDTRAAWALATDPEEKQRLEQQFGAIKTATADTDEDLGSARSAAEETRAGELQRLANERQQAERAAMVDAGARFKEIQDQAAAAERERQERAATAEQELASDRESYRNTLAAGPSSQENWVAQVVAMTGEVLMAGAQGRVPNFGPILDRLQNAAKADWQAQVQAKLDAVAEGKEGIDKIAAEQREIQAQAEAQKVAILEQVETQLQTQLAEADTALDKLRIQDAIESVQVERAQREAAAFQTYQQNLLEARKAEADIELKQAQARKTGAEAGIAERKAIGGTRRPATMGVRKPNEVTAPGTNEVLAVFEDTPAGHARAAKANDLVSAQAETLRLLNEYEASLEEYGRRGLFDDTNFRKSKEYQTLETQRALIVGPMAKMQAGGGAPSETERKAAEDLVQLPAGWWQSEDTALAGLRELKRNAEETFREKANPYFKTPVMEKLISQWRVRSTSASDRRKDLEGRAAEILRDTTAAPSDRAAAWGAIEARARKTADQQGDEDRWALLAAEDITLLLRDLTADTANQQANRATIAAGAQRGRALRKRLRKQVEGIIDIGRSGQPLSDEKRGDIKRLNAAADQLDEALDAAGSWWRSGAAPEDE